MLRDATQTALLQALDANQIPYVLQKTENVLLMKDTGARILLRSLEEFERLRGTNLAWFGVDELTYCKEAAWLRLEGRLRDPGAERLCGFAVWTPKGHDWVYKRFLVRAAPGYETIIAKAMENRHILDKIPDFYERLRHSYDEKFFRQEVLGEYLNTQEGMAYHAFKRHLHVQEPEVDTEAPLLWALDFNVDPMCSVVAQISGDTVNVLDEIVLSRASTAQACEEFLNRYPNHEKGLRIYGDATGNNMSSRGKTDYEIVKASFRRSDYRSLEYRLGRSNPAVRDRIGSVNARLMNAAGEVNLKVSPKCDGLIEDLERVSYKEGSSVIDKESDSQRTHLSDALGYLIWQEFKDLGKIGGRRERFM